MSNKEINILGIIWIEKIYSANINKEIQIKTVKDINNCLKLHEIKIILYCWLINWYIRKPSCYPYAILFINKSF